MRNILGGDMLFWRPEGPQLEYRDRTFFIADLNPEREIRWAVTPGELFAIGLKCLVAAVRAKVNK